VVERMAEGKGFDPMLFKFEYASRERTELEIPSVSIFRIDANTIVYDKRDLAQ
jgi:hypothetical protein